MNLLFRFLYLILTSPFREKLSFLDECKTNFRCYPTDLDLNMHINNGKYLSLMDLGRFDLVFRNGFMNPLRKFSIYPVVSSQMIRYQKAIAPFQKFSIYTKCIGWDETYFFLQQRFESEGGVVALALVKARFLRKGHRGFKNEDFFDLLSLKIESPRIPAWVYEWTEAEQTSWNELSKG